jgi:hypothetical protein
VRQRGSVLEFGIKEEKKTLDTAGVVRDTALIRRVVLLVEICALHLDKMIDNASRMWEPREQRR